MDERELTALVEAYKRGEQIPIISDEVRQALQKLLVAPVQKPDVAEIERVRKLIEVERKWWEHEPNYESLVTIEGDIGKGVLVRVESDENLKLIMRLQNQLVDGYLPYLKKETAALLKEVGAVWREVSKSYGIKDDIQLAVTNLLVTTEYRDRMIKMGKLAFEEASHSKGQSFDIDGCGYYEESLSVNPRQTTDYGKRYNKDIHIALRAVLDRMQAAGLLHFIPEFQNTNNQSFHVTRNPNYSSD